MKRARVAVGIAILLLLLPRPDGRSTPQAWPWPLPPLALTDPDPELRFRRPIGANGGVATEAELDSEAVEEAAIGSLIPYGIQPTGPARVYRMPDGLRMLLELPTEPDPRGRVRVADASGDLRYSASRFFSPGGSEPGPQPALGPGLAVLRVTGGSLEPIALDLLLPAPDAAERQIPWPAESAVLQVPPRSAAAIDALELQVGERSYRWDFRAAPADPALLDAGSLPELLAGIIVQTPPGTSLALRMQLWDSSGGQWTARFRLDHSP